MIHCTWAQKSFVDRNRSPYHCPVFHILLPNSSFALLVPTQTGLRQLKWLSSVTYPPFAQVGLGSPFLLWKLYVSFPLKCSFWHSFCLSFPPFSEQMLKHVNCKTSEEKGCGGNSTDYTHTLEMQKTWTLTILNEVLSSGKVCLGNAFWLRKEVQKP